MANKAKKLYYFFRNPIYKLYCFIVRPTSLGTKIVVEYDNKFLLVRISYLHKGWTFPGGGVDKNESFKQGALRELREETGIVVNDLVEIGQYESGRNFKKNIVKCFYLTTDSDKVTIDNFEILEARWFDLETLPENRSDSVDQILGIYKEFKK